MPTTTKMGVHIQYSRYIASCLQFTNILTHIHREQLTTNRFEAVEKLLQMLLLVVKQPGSLSMQLLPSILDFALNYMSPVLLQGRIPTEFCDVILALYLLFDG